MTLRSEEIDPRILALLREDARRNVSELATALGVSRTAIYSSIERLERQGTIVGYTVRLGEDYDRSLIRAHVMVKLYPKATQATIDRLREDARRRAAPAVDAAADCEDKSGGQEWTRAEEASPRALRLVAVWQRVRQLQRL